MPSLPAQQVAESQRRFERGFLDYAQATPLHASAWFWWTTKEDLPLLLSPRSLTLRPF